MPTAPLTPPDHAAVAPKAIELDALDAADAPDLRLRPIGLLTGGAASVALARGEALPLAGGATVFSFVEVLARTPLGMVAAVAPLARLRAWQSKQSAATSVLVESQLARICERRDRWAGLGLDRPLVMGILNVTPDSLFGGIAADPEKAVASGRAMLAAGADILDIGAESTRPGAVPVSPDEELRRLEPVVRVLTSTGAAISVDTRHAPVMAAALGWGARIINDVSALEGAGSLDVIARSGAAVVLMHMQGVPGTMQRDPHYDLASFDIVEYLARRIAACNAAGVPPHRIVVDPGIGFGKTLAHNLEILARLTLFHGLGCGVLLGLSRKSMIGSLAGSAAVEARLPGSIAGALEAVRQGAQILRVHDVAETRQAIDFCQAVATGA